jgi:serine/threonine-protein kinase RsbT
MATAKPEILPVDSDADIVTVRQAVRRWAVLVGFSLVDQTKLVTAASELARNMVVHGGGGRALLEPLAQNGRRGLAIVFEDKGPGIPDVAAALRDGFTTTGGLGLGLGGARRLSSDFEITSRPGDGTRVRIARWT